mmetsp:Transcript_85590/g.205166  ORF Transcript_85590/g.205166 Transcript_85590/m.205166 type:complete len:251 (+) Transcript_85590:107-859(+)
MRKTELPSLHEGLHLVLVPILRLVWDLGRWGWRSRRFLRSFSGFGDFLRYSLQVGGIRKLDYLINEAVVLCLFCRHEVVPHEVCSDCILVFACHTGIHPHDVLVNLQNLLCFDLDVLCLALCSTHRLVDHDPTVRQRNTFALLARREQERGHGCCKANVDCDHRGLDMLHSVVDGQASNHRSAGAIDVQVYGLVVVLGIQIQQNSNDLICQLVIDFLANENNSFSIESVVDVNPFCIRCSRDPVGHLGHA